MQRIIREDNLVANVCTQGALLEKLLHEYLDDHPHVGNIRGKGLFWGVSHDANKDPRIAVCADRPMIQDRVCTR